MTLHYLHNFPLIPTYRLMSCYIFLHLVVGLFCYAFFLSQFT